MTSCAARSHHQRREKYAEEIIPWWEI